MGAELLAVSGVCCRLSRCWFTVGRVLVVVTVVLDEARTSFLAIPRDNDVVMRVAVVWDQGAAILDACEFNFAWVYMLNGDNETLAFVLNHNLFFADGSGGQLRINILADSNVATDNVQMNAVRLREVWVVSNFVLFVPRRNNTFVSPRERILVGELRSIAS